jgi:hypothetical protein
MSAKKAEPIERFYKDCKKRIGRIYTSEELRTRGPAYMNTCYNTEVTADGITHFVDGIGDLNPLYRNREYAIKSKYGCLVAPPNYIYTITYSQFPDVKPIGLSGFYAGSAREWFRPLYEGDKISFRVMFPSDVELKESKFAGEKVMLYEKGEYFNQEQRLVGAYNCWIIYVDDQRSAEMDKHHGIAEIPEYSEEDIKNVYAAQDSEVVRGPEPRYWEEVEVGEELTPVVRGPYTLAEQMAWVAGAHGSLHVSERLTRILMDRDPGQRHFYDPRLKIYSPFDQRDSSLLQKRGVPRIYAAGEQTEAWRNMVLTNWMGDDGFLWKSSTQIRGMNLQGDITWCRGKVTQKYCDNGKHCVDIDCWCENQRGEVTIPGTATVMLPSRIHGPVVYPEPRGVIRKSG